MSQELLERIENLEAEMYRQGFWKRPAPLPPPIQEVVARNVDWWDEPGSVVNATFDYDCAGCGVEVKETIRISAKTPQGFLHQVKCWKGHVTHVRFPVRCK